MRMRRLVVDPVACDGFGYCAELLPELILLDEWGFPIVAPGAVPASLEGLAERAVASCPRLALTLERIDGAAGQSSGTQAAPSHRTA